MKYTVYKITNLVNNKIYIGVHKTNNLDDEYMGSGKLIKLAIEKYGIENFSKEYLAIFDNPEEMFEMESELVNEDFVKDKETYNLKEGGYGGFDHLNSDKEAMSIRNSKASVLAIEKKKWLYENDAEWCSKVTKKKKALTKKQLDIGTSGFAIQAFSSSKPFLGKKHTDETKKKMSESSLGKGSGEKNSQFGTMWIYNIDLKESKKINKEDFPTWEQDGWLKGRKIKF